MSTASQCFSNLTLCYGHFSLNYMFLNYMLCFYIHILSPRVGLHSAPFFSTWAHLTPGSILNTWPPLHPSPPSLLFRVLGIHDTKLACMGYKYAQHAIITHVNFHAMNLSAPSTCTRHKVIRCFIFYGCKALQVEVLRCRAVPVKCLQVQGWRRRRRIGGALRGVSLLGVHCRVYHCILLYIIYPALEERDQYCGCKEWVKSHLIMTNFMNNFYRVRESSLGLSPLIVLCDREFCVTGR